MQAVEARAQSPKIASPRLELPRLESLEAVARSFPLPEKSASPSLDDELRQWKLARRRNFEIPWRPLSLMASLFFGVASFALPDSVNHVVRWPLYALAVMSFLAGSRRRRQQAKT